MNEAILAASIIFNKMRKSKKGLATILEIKFSWNLGRQIMATLWESKNSSDHYNLLSNH